MSKQWTDEFNKWCDTNSMQHAPKKVLDFLETQVVQPRMKKVMDTIKEKEIIEIKNRELLKVIDQLTLELAECKQKLKI